MKPRDLPDLATLAAVARHKSFARAAVELGVSRSALSHAVSGLEERFGLRLLNRTTRSVATTEAGERLLAELGPALDRIARVVDDVSGREGRPRGRLRLNVPRLGALLVVGAPLAGFLAAYPGIEVDIAVEEAMVDIVARGFDAGMRFGRRVPKDMIAMPIGPPADFAVVGAPAYFAKHGRPRAPRELARHACIGFRLRGTGGLYDWSFCRRGRASKVAVSGSLTVDETDTMLHAAVAGIGVAYLPLQIVARHVESGALVRVLSEWCEPTQRIHLYYPSRRHVPAALRAFVDWLRAYRWE